MDLHGDGLGRPPRNSGRIFDRVGLVGGARPADGFPVALAHPLVAFSYNVDSFHEIPISYAV